MKVNHIRQNVFPVLAALIWGTAFVAQSVAADHVGPFTFTAARSAVAFVFLLVLCLVFRCLRRRDFQEEAQARPGSWRDLAIGGICCGVVLTMGTNLQQMGLETTTSGKAGFITALYIVIVPIAGIFLRQKGAPGDLAQCGAGGGGIVSAVRAGVLFHHGGGLVRAAVLLLLRRTHPADRPLYPEGGRGGPVLRTVPGDGGALCRADAGDGDA